MSEQPSNPAQKFQAALWLHQSGRLAEAEHEYRQILLTDDKFAPAWHLLGVLLLQTNRPPQALQHIQRAIDLGLNGADVWSNLGESFRANNRFAEAIAAYQNAILLNPNGAPAYANLGTAYNETGRFAEAIPHFEKSLSLRPDHANTLYQYALALWNVGKNDQVITVLEKAFGIAPEAKQPEIAELLASAYYLVRKPHKSLEIVDRALVRHPMLPILHRHRSLALLGLGRFAEGWEEHEWRWRVDAPLHNPVRDFNRPMWDGSDPAGRKILVHPEQGFGDLIQFARYVPMLVAAGAEVILEVPFELRDLMGSLRCKATIMPKGVKPPDFDLHIPLMSLPRIYKTTADSIPADVPYLFAAQSRIEKFQQHIADHAAGKFKVALIWAGRALPDPRRTVPSRQLFDALSPVPNVSWFSLQAGEQQTELKVAPAAMNVLDMSPQLKDFADTAAAISLMDLTITIDTATSHLAGALGAKTWTLLTAAPDWRWGWDGPATPWYPTMRLFRQDVLGQWGAVMRAVSKELTAIDGGT